MCSRITQPLKKTAGFTLIELLISVTIFMMLIGITANLLATLSDMGEKSVAIVDMHQQANEFMTVFNIDMRNMHITTAVAQNFEDPLKQHTTFMMNQKRELGKAGGSYGPYSTVADKTNFDYMWVRWEIDLMNGMIHRGRTAPGGFSIANMRELYFPSTNANDTGGLRNYHRFAKPQTEYLYFEGKGTPKTSSTAYAWDSDSAIKPGERRIMYQHYNFSQNVDRHATDIPFRWDKYYKYNIYNQSVIGNYRLLSDECFAVKNKDGITYNKDRLFLVGAPDETGSSGITLYPGQIRPLGLQPNIECAMISYHFADNTQPADDDTMGDSSATIDIKGTGPQLRNSTSINNRPDYAVLSFLLHNIPEDDPDIDDIDGDSTTAHFIDALRNKIHIKDGTPLTYANYITEIQDRQQKMLAIIDQNGYIGQLFHNSVAFPK